MPIQPKTSLRAPLLYILIGLIAGLILAKGMRASPLLILLSSAAFTILSFRLSPKEQYTKLWYPSFILASTLCFWAYGAARMPEKPDEFTLSLPQREANLILKVERITNPNDSFGRSTGIGSIIEAHPTSRLKASQQIYFQIKADEASKVTRGAQLQATGLLKPIPPINQDSSKFESYLKESGIHYIFKRISQIETLHASTTLHSFYNLMNERFQDFLQLGAPPNSGLENIYIAMLLGRKVDLSKEQAERFRLSGTMHFFAISGLHIGVIATVIAQFLTLVRLPRKYSPFIGLPLLYLYVEITGAAPSAMRAFLMTAFFWASFALNRQRSPLPALIGSAVFVLIIDPNQLWSVGFQLSYIVVLSILLFGLPLHEFIKFHVQPFRWLPPESWTWRQRAINSIIEKLSLLFAISFAAWIASTPLSASLFGFIAPGAILLNMILVNLAALVISGGIIALGTALLGAIGICTFLNHSAWLLISVMDRIITSSLHIPGAYLRCENFPDWLSYLTLTCFFALLFRFHLKPTDPFSRIQPILIAPLIVLLPVALGLALFNQA